MKIKYSHRRTLLCSAAFGVLSMSGAAWAQEDTTDEDTVVELIEEEEDEARQEKIVVTGSRIARDSFTSTAPLQVVTAENIRDAGLVDLGEVLQSTSVVTGSQLDQTVTTSGFLGDGGPGGSSVGLRGLDAERTLVLVNGRRLAPAGVEGAPSFPDISLIPTSIVERIDVLLDGASSVYGSDAVAGVVNVVLRDEYDGFNIGISRSDPIEDGGESTSINAILGATGDRGSFMLAGEYLVNEPLLSNSRDWMAGDDGRFCDRAIELDADGNEIRQCNSFQAGIGILEPSFILYYGVPGVTAAESDIGFGLADGIANFVNGRGDLAVSPNGYGRWRDYLAGSQEEFQVTPNFERTSLYLSAKRDVDILGGMELFTEISFNNRQTSANNGAGQFTAPIPAENPFNPFGDNAPANTIAGVIGTQDASALLVTPWDNVIEVELDQYRVIGGARGDFTVRDKPWNYETFAGYTRSQGFSQRTGVNEVNLALTAYTTQLDNDGNPVCGLEFVSERPDVFGGFFGISPEPCVPINFFSPTLFQANPTFAEGQAAVDYLRDVRTVTTFVDEAIVGGYASGPIFDVPAGEVQAVLGFEWRDDAIDTKSDSVAQRATLDGFFFDRPTKGSVYIGELYGELFVPLVKDQPFAHNAEIELAGRLIEHEFYGNDSTYSIKGSYSPVDYLTFKGTFGTSFRAPNLRELFLEGQSSFEVATDPCEVPATATAFDPVTGDPFYDAANDDRDPQILTNCQAEGLDPTELGLRGGSTQFQAVNAGNTGLEPEESEAWSIGITVEQPFTDAFDLTLGVTQFDLDIENTVVTPSLNTILGICYTADNFPNNAFCSRRLRDPNTGFLTEVDATPFNVSSRKSSGIDFNGRYTQEFTAFGQEVNLDIDVQATKSDEISLLIDIPGEEEDFTDFVGDIGFPEWRGRAQVALDIQDLRISLISNYIGSQEDLTPPGTTTADGVSTVASVDEYWRHTLSARYATDDYAIQVGIQNLLDEDPPLVDQDVTGQVSNRNVPLGVGYDQAGRAIFVALSKSF